MSRSIEDMDPTVQIRARALLAALQSAGLHHVVTCTRRTVEEQLAYFAQGRAQLAVVQALRAHAGMRMLEEAENKYTVTKADGVFSRSRHQEGRAIDITPATLSGQPTWEYLEYAKQYRAIGAIARGLGWNCGMDWAPVNLTTMLGADPPHYEIG